MAIQSSMLLPHTHTHTMYPVRKKKKPRERAVMWQEPVTALDLADPSTPKHLSFSLNQFHSWRIWDDIIYTLIIQVHHSTLNSVPQSSLRKSSSYAWGLSNTEIPGKLKIDKPVETSIFTIMHCYHFSGSLQFQQRPLLLIPYRIHKKIYRDLRHGSTYTYNTNR